MPYYSEEVEKNTQYRNDYKRSLEAFVERCNAEATARRDAFMSPESYAADPEKYRQYFIDMMGFPLRASRDEQITADKHFVARDGNVDIWRMQLTIMGIKFYGMYFVQVEEPEKAPFVVGLHGGSGTPEIVSSIHHNSSNYNHLVRRLTDRGCNVFCPQLYLWDAEMYGDAPDRAELHHRMLMLGGSATSLELFLLSRSVDYFVDNENNNADRIGVAGLSYGGQFSLDLAAYDTRVKACAAQAQFADRYAYPERDWSYPNALNTISDAEKAALVAPRALLLNMGDHDWIYDAEPSVRESKRAEKFFEAMGVPEKYDFYVFDGSHETDPSDRWVDFLLKYL